VVSSSRVFEIIDHPDTTPELPEAEPLRPGAGAVRFTHVNFSYEPGRPILHDVCFSVPAGSVIALVGPTGAGKTTVAALLGRFYDPDIGSIEIDGEDIREAQLQSVRDAVGYVFQETYLFSDTVARNIAYGDMHAPLSKIKEAAHIAQADEFIDKLPQQYETVIGEYGAMLSGGQKQRLAIARAILCNPRILVLDDSLSAVDPETETAIRAGLERIMKGRTVFLITSRVSTARRADQILVVENGRITQRGTHQELVARVGYYSEVVNSQFVEMGARQEKSHMDRMTQKDLSKRAMQHELEEDA
jgi:ABC-type multidrug transport system fused ATPase/permease subunit